MNIFTRWWMNRAINKAEKEMLKDKTYNRNKEMFRLSKKVPVDELASRYNLAVSTVERILADWRKWGEFA